MRGSMREITHQLAFPHSSEGSRYSDVFDPNDGGVQARVALGDRVAGPGGGGGTGDSAFIIPTMG